MLDHPLKGHLRALGSCYGSCLVGSLSLGPDWAGNAPLPSAVPQCYHSAACAALWCTVHGATTVQCHLLAQGRRARGEQDGRALGWALQPASARSMRAGNPATQGHPVIINNLPQAAKHLSPRTLRSASMNLSALVHRASLFSVSLMVWLLTCVRGPCSAWAWWCGWWPACGALAQRELDGVAGDLRTGLWQGTTHLAPGRALCDCTCSLSGHWLWFLPLMRIAHSQGLCPNRTTPLLKEQCAVGLAACHKLLGPVSTPLGGQGTHPGWW